MSKAIPYTEVPMGWKMTPISGFEFPEHKYGLYLHHNQHRDRGMSVAEFFAAEVARIEADCRRDPTLKYLEREFRNPDSRQRCIETDELWELAWFRDSRVDCLAVAAPTLAELLEFANEKATA